MLKLRRNATAFLLIALLGASWGHILSHHPVPPCPGHLDGVHLVAAVVSADAECPFCFVSAIAITLSILGVFLGSVIARPAAVPLRFHPAFSSKRSCRAPPR